MIVTSSFSRHLDSDAGVPEGVLSTDQRLRPPSMAPTMTSELQISKRRVDEKTFETYNKNTKQAKSNTCLINVTYTRLRKTHCSK